MQGWLKAFDGAQEHYQFLPSEASLVDQQLLIGHHVEAARGWKWDAKRCEYGTVSRDQEEAPGNTQSHKVQAVFHRAWLPAECPQPPKRPSKPPAWKGTGTVRPYIVIIDPREGVPEWATSPQHACQARAAALLAEAPPVRVVIETFMEGNELLKNHTVQCLQGSPLADAVQSLPDFALAGIVDVLEKRQRLERAWCRRWRACFPGPRSTWPSRVLDAKRMAFKLHIAPGSLMGIVHLRWRPFPNRISCLAATLPPRLPGADCKASASVQMDSMPGPCSSQSAGGPDTSNKAPETERIKLPGDLNSAVALEAHQQPGSADTRTDPGGHSEQHIEQSSPAAEPLMEPLSPGTQVPKPLGHASGAQPGMLTSAQLSDVHCGLSPGQPSPAARQPVLSQQSGSRSGAEAAAQQAQPAEQPPVDRGTQVRGGNAAGMDEGAQQKANAPGRESSQPGKACLAAPTELSQARSADCPLADPRRKSDPAPSMSTCNDGPAEPLHGASAKESYQAQWDAASDVPEQAPPGDRQPAAWMLSLMLADRNAACTLKPQTLKTLEAEVWQRVISAFCVVCRRHTRTVQGLLRRHRSVAAWAQNQGSLK